MMRNRHITSLLSGQRPVPGTSLSEHLDARTRPADLAHKQGDAIRCVACGHRCLLREGRRGICKVRYNHDGRLMAPSGYVAGLQSDPVEKKPLFHVLPGSDALTFGMLGCDFHCGYCQNWLTSQALRDESAGTVPEDLTAGELARIAVNRGARIVASSYNEPLITAEWAREIFTHARERDLVTAFISNGNATPEVLDYIRPVTDCYKIDLKSMSDRAYRRLGGVLQHVLDAVQMVYERGFWLEVVTLIVTDFNDEEEEIRSAARFLASVSPNIPWHVTGFHADYRMTDNRDTSAAQIVRACEIGREEGLRFVYAGNRPGQVEGWEHTRCPDCDEVVVERTGYVVRAVRLENGRCRSCDAAIPGVWS